jgi:hypothetical protein
MENTRIILLWLLALLAMHLSLPESLAGPTVFYPPAVVQNQAAKAEKKPADGRTKTGDKIDKTMKGPNGETVYTGPRGGKYYLNKKNQKVYLKKE